jgi:predicted aldo/keto reductase-like oxidoreductase
MEADSMSKDDREDGHPARLTRRGLLAGAAAAAAAALSGTAPEAQGAAQQSRAAGPKPLPKRVLGRTGLKVTAFSLGTIGGQTDVLKVGLARGINFMHCAMGYGTLPAAAAAIGGKRDSLFLGLKYERPGRADWEYLNRALQLLQVDYVDILFFPLNSPDNARDRQHLEFFQQVKRRKQARFIGITTHSNVAPTIQAAVDAGFWDVLMLSYVSAPEARAALRPVLDQAKKKNLGVVAMKTMTGIRPNATVQMQTALQRVLADPGVTTLVKGMLTFELLEMFLTAAGSGSTRGARAALDQHLASCRGDMCILCGECPSCPRGVSVFEVMRAFAYYYAQAGMPQFARAEYRAIPSAASGGLCDDCGACAQRCPYGVDIARQVRAAHLVLA